jgi:predicted O-methyltransferase YrrM
MRKIASLFFGLLRQDPASAQRLLAYILRKQPQEYLEPAARLSEKTLAGAALFADREAMLGALPKGGIVAEVGTWQGYFSNQIARQCEPDEFHLIDIDLSHMPEINTKGKVLSHEGDSSTILSSFPPNHFDWIYIDGDHRYEGIRKDIEAADGVLKPDGRLTCNDYTNWCSTAVTPYGVMRAVNEFIISRNYSVEGLAFHPTGQHDILIRKPS